MWRFFIGGFVAGVFNGLYVWSVKRLQEEDEEE